MELTAESNPYLEYFDEFCKSAPSDIHRMFDPTLDESRRDELYGLTNLDIAMKYAWAIPDERALQIIKHFGPIVEMGAGTGYWAKLLELRGVDIIPYDLIGSEEGAIVKDEQDKEASGKPPDSEDSEQDGESEEEYEEVDVHFWTKVISGCPQNLQKHADRSLFLCYPDDYETSNESMALQCLENYSGDTVIHVGELFGQTVCLPNPWGRTSSEAFQTRLSTIYHKILEVPLPSWHSSIDTLSVWNRTKTSIIDGCIFAYIPPEERVDLITSCPSTRHLIHPNSQPDKKSKKRNVSSLDI